MPRVPRPIKPFTPNIAGHPMVKKAYYMRLTARRMSVYLSELTVEELDVLYPRPEHKALHPYMVNAIPRKITNAFQTLRETYCPKISIPDMLSMVNEEEITRRQVTQLQLEGVI